MNILVKCVYYFLFLQRRPSNSGSSISQNPPAPLERSPSRRPSNPKSLKKTTSVLTKMFGSSNGEIKCKESDVKTIVKMGFSRDQAVWALAQNDHNVAMAINSLTR